MKRPLASEDGEREFRIALREAEQTGERDPVRLVVLAALAVAPDHNLGCPSHRVDKRRRDADANGSLPCSCPWLPMTFDRGGPCESHATRCAACNEPIEDVNPLRDESGAPFHDRCCPVMVTP